MLELLDTDDLQAIADSLTAGPGPHVWHHGEIAAWRRGGAVISDVRNTLPRVTFAPLQPLPQEVLGDRIAKSALLAQ